MERCLVRSPCRWSCPIANTRCCVGGCASGRRLRHWVLRSRIVRRTGRTHRSRSRQAGRRGDEFGFTTANTISASAAPLTVCACVSGAHVSGCPIPYGPGASHAGARRAAVGGLCFPCVDGRVRQRCSRHRAWSAPPLTPGPECRCDSRPGLHSGTDELARTRAVQQSDHRSGCDTKCGDHSNGDPARARHISPSRVTPVHVRPA